MQLVLSLLHMSVLCCSELLRYSYMPGIILHPLHPPIHTFNNILWYLYEYSIMTLSLPKLTPHHPPATLSQRQNVLLKIVLGIDLRKNPILNQEENLVSSNKNPFTTCVWPDIFISFQNSSYSLDTYNLVYRKMFPTSLKVGQKFTTLQLFVTSLIEI